MPRGGHKRGVNHVPVQARRWLDCCLSAELHRFDCGEVEPHKRSGGPYLPIKAAP